MFETLDSIAWGELEHAYGPATDVPDALRALASDEAPVRKRAFDQLENNINHQGLSTPAAPEVVPFLLELVRSPTVKDKHRLLVLLADLAVAGSHVNHIAGGYDVARNPDLLAHEIPRTLHERVAAGIDAYLGLLRDKSAPVRTAAALVLAFLSDHAARSAPVLRERLDAEQHEQARASALLCLGLLGRYLRSGEDRGRFEAGLRPGHPPLLRFAAAMALLYVSDKHLGHEAGQTLVETAVTPARPVAGFPWHGGDLQRFAVETLNDLAIATGDLDLSRRLFAASAPSQLVYIATAMLRMAFPDQTGPAGTLRLPRELTTTQRAALETIVSRTVGWVGFREGDWSGSPLDYYGLPGVDVDLKRYLGLPPLGPLDTVVDGKPLWLLARRTLDGALPEDRWLASVGTLGPAQVVEVCADAARGGYCSCWPARPDMPKDGSDLVRLLVNTLVRHASVERLSAHLEEMIAAPARPRLQFVVAATALSVLLSRRGEVFPARLDAALAIPMQWDTGVPFIREVLATLPPERRKSLVLPLPLFPGDCPPVKAWAYIDLCPGAEAAEKVVECVLSSAKDPRRGPPPLERAVAPLVAAGPAFVRRLRELLADQSTPHRAIFERALAELERESSRTRR